MTKLNRRSFLKSVSALAASGILAWKYDKEIISADAAEDIKSEDIRNEHPFAPYYDAKLEPPVLLW